MALDEDIAAAIDNDLPNQIGQRLRQRLDEADSILLDHDQLQQDHATLRKEVDQLRTEKSRWAEMDEREKNLNSQQKVIERNEIRVEILEEQMQKRLQDNMTILTQVFKGPASKLAFDLWGNANNLMTDSGYSSSPSVGLGGVIKSGDDK